MCATLGKIRGEDDSRRAKGGVDGAPSCQAFRPEPESWFQQLYNLNIYYIH